MWKLHCFSSAFLLLTACSFASAQWSAQWSDPWISSIPEGSPASPYVTLDRITSTDVDMSLVETCPGDSAIAVLHYNGTSLPTFSSSNGCNAKLSITKNDNNITYINLINPLDYEAFANPLFFCFLSLKGSPDPKSLALNLEDANDNVPYFPANTTNVLNFAENKLGKVYTFSAIDKDDRGKGNLTFTLDVKQGSADKFQLKAVPPNSADLIVVEELDREEENFYLLEITVSDKDGQNATKEVALNVDDERDSPPVFKKTIPFQRITEGLPLGTQIFKVEARDGDTFNDPITYSLDDARKTFTIDPDTGAVKVASWIDRDIADFDPYFYLTITATVKRPDKSEDSAQTNTTVFVDDLNDNVPSFNQKIYTMDVREDFTGRLTDYEIKVSDPDLDNGGAYQVKVKGPAADFVKITPSDGKGRNDVTFNLVIDHPGLVDYENETSPRQVSFELEVVEVLDSTHTNTSTVVINAQDVNDNDPKLTVDLDGGVTSIYEKSSATYDGLTVANFAATDKDSGSNGKVMFRLSPYNLEGFNEFAIDPDTGRLYVKNSNLLDYDSLAKSFKFFVEAYDNNPFDPLSVTRTATQLITVNLMDVNDNAPTLEPSNGPLATVKETDATKDALVAVIQAEDKDQPNTDNSRLQYTLHSQRRIVTTESCPHTDGFFRIDSENNKGLVKVDVFNLTNCYGYYEIVVQANDFGDNLIGKQYSENITYQIQVNDTNNNAPEFIFPAKDGSSIVYVYETTKIGAPLNSTSGIVIELSASDLDIESNGEVRFRCDDKEFSSTFEIANNGPNKAVIILKSELNRTKASNYTFNIKAYDGGEPSLESITVLRIYVRFEKKQNPYFNQQKEEVAFFENQQEIKSFQMAIDPDNITLYPGEESYDICYYIACGNAIDFTVGGGDKKQSTIRTNGTLDREKPPEMLYVVIEASNSCDKQTTNPGLYPCTGVDLTQIYYLNVSINIKDEKDCPPEFTESLYGGTTFGDKKGKEVLRVMTTDADEDDSATCIIKDNNITASDPSLPTNVSFTIEERNKIVLNFDVQDSMKGYFTFDVTCTDTNYNSQTAMAQIFILDTTHKVNVVFQDPVKEVDGKRSSIERIFGETYGYECNVEQVTENPPDDVYDVSTTVVMHFIDTAKVEPVLASDIEKFKLNSTLNARLNSEFTAIELTLIRIGSIKEEVDVTAQIFMILFIIACVLIIAILLYGFFLITRMLELKRKVKALSTTKFGSTESINKRLGVAVPNTNVFAEGSNPIFQSNVHNSESNFVPRGSDSSGDSVLVGVEDNPEFSGYKPKNNLSQGTWDLTKAVDDPLRRPSSFANPVRNPLAGLVIDEEENDVTNFGSDSESEADDPVMFFGGSDQRPPPPAYPPPPLPTNNAQLTKRPAPPPPVINNPDYDYESETEL